MADDAEALIDTLTARLTPVTPRRAGRDWLAFALLAVVEAAAYIGLIGPRHDMHAAMGQMAFWWKAVSLVILAAIGVSTTIAALSPDRSPRRGLRRLGVAAALAVVAGWILDASQSGTAALVARLDWREGLACVGVVVALALPALGVLALLMRRGAATDPRGAATAAGAAAAAWGGAVFTINCPHDDPFYIAVWFAAAIGAVMLVARAALPRLTRW